MNKFDFQPIPKFGDLISIEQFREYIDEGYFIDYDGCGELSDGKQVAKNSEVYPSLFKINKVIFVDLLGIESTIDIPNWVTHVVWYNK